MRATRVFHNTLPVKINLPIIIVIIVVVIVVVVIVCVINATSFDPCDGSNARFQPVVPTAANSREPVGTDRSISTCGRKSKSMSKCKFCFKPVQFYGSRW